MPPIGPTTPAPLSSQNTLPAAKPNSSTKPPTLPQATVSPPPPTGAFNPLWVGLAPQASSPPSKDGYMEVRPHEPNPNSGYLDISPAHEPSTTLTPPQPPSNLTIKCFILPLGILGGSTLENILRQPAGYVATKNVMNGIPLNIIFESIKRNPIQVYGETFEKACTAFRFNTAARFIQRGGCFEINHTLNGLLKDVSATPKALVTTGILTAYEYLVNTPADRANTLYQAGQIKSPGDAFKMNNLGQLWRTLKSPATWEAGGAVFCRNSTFNLVMVAALQNEPDSIKTTPMHYGYLGLTSFTCSVASQPFEVLRFKSTDKTIDQPPKPYPAIASSLMKEGIQSFWRGSIPRIVSVGGGLMVSLTVYSEVKSMIAKLESGNN